jgi:hypothetical protein
MTEWDKYYTDQAKGGSGFYSGPLWQKGGSARGFAGQEWQEGGGWGSYLWRVAQPLLKFLGKEVLQTGVDVGSDVLKGADIKESLVNRGKRTVARIADQAASKLKGGKKMKLMKGGRRRRRRTAVKMTKKKTKRTVKRKKRSVGRRRSNRKNLHDIFA